MAVLVGPQLVKQDSQVPLLKITSLVTCVKNIGLGVEVHAANREIDGILAINWNINWVFCFCAKSLLLNLLLSIEEDLAA